MNDSKETCEISQTASFGKLARSFRDYIAVHDGINLGGHAMDILARDLARIATTTLDLSRSYDSPSMVVGALSGRLEQPTDAEIDAVFDRLPGGVMGFLKQWGYRQFAREILGMAPSMQSPCLHQIQEPAAKEHAEKLAICFAKATNIQTESTACAGNNVGNVSCAKAAPAAVEVPDIEIALLMNRSACQKYPNDIDLRIAHNEGWKAGRAALTAAPSVPADPMDWPLPCDVTVGHGTIGKGVKLSMLVLRMKALYQMATGDDADEVAARTPEQRAQLFLLKMAAIPAAAAPPSVPALSRACDLLSSAIGTLMGQREKIGYTDNSPVAAMVNEAVEFLRPWPEKLPSAAAAPVVLPEPAAHITKVDDDGVSLRWFVHWLNYPVGTKLFTEPQVLALLALPRQPHCSTCNDHGAVGNILTAEPCADCNVPSPVQVAQSAAINVPASGAAALSEYLKECSQHSIVPDVGGAFAYAFKAGFSLAIPLAAASAVAVPDEHEAFEAKFPMPANCMRCGDGYASTSFNGWDAYRHVERWEGWKARAALAATTAAQAPRTWRGGKLTVADLVNNLLMMDQALPIYGAQYIEQPAGRRRAIAVPPTVSIERVKDSRWIGEGEALNTVIVWTRAEQPAAAAPVELPEPRWHNPKPCDAAHFPYYSPEDVRALLAQAATAAGCSEQKGQP